MSKLPRELSNSQNSTTQSQNTQTSSSYSSTSSSTVNGRITSTADKSDAMTAKTAQPPVMLMGNGMANAASSISVDVGLKKSQGMVKYQQCGSQVQATCSGNNNSISSIPRSLPLTIPNGAAMAAAAAATVGLEIDGLSSASSTSSLASLGYSVPFNFAMVWPGVYRCSFPKEDHFEYLKFLGLKTILTLVPEEYPGENVKFMKENGIQHFQIGMHGNKESLARIPHEKISQAVSIVLDRRNHPILIHCNKGKHRTGCVVGCVRKVQKWTTTSVIDEYRHYSAPKNRIMDEQLLQSWDGHHLAEFAAQQGGWTDRTADPPQKGNANQKAI